MGFAAQKTYDIEVWLPGQGRFREISSCSICGDFQARRMNARGKPRTPDRPVRPYAERLGVAVGRALIAVLENTSSRTARSRFPKFCGPIWAGDAV